MGIDQESVVDRAGLRDKMFLDFRPLSLMRGAGSFKVPPAWAE
jgi:hypothetical protein